MSCKDCLPCPATDCPSYIDSHCIYWSGSTLVNSQTFTNDRLDVILQKIDRLLGQGGGVNADWTASSGPSFILHKPNLAVVATTGSYTDLLNKPVFATVAFTGSYSDLTGKPNLATVATTGSYLDLINRPTIPAAPVQADWNQASTGALDYIKNKPSIPSPQVNSDWNASSGIAQILNRPTLATVATTGSYTDLLNTPSPYSLPIASGSVLGGIKVGTGLSISGSGVLSTTGVSSVGATIASSALLISGSPITTSGTLAFSWTGSSGQYVRGDGSLSTLAAIALSGSATDLTAGTVPTGRYGALTIPLTALNASGTPDATTYLRGDGSWSTPPSGGGGGGTVTSVAASVTASTALSIAGSPITGAGTLAFSWTGTSAQYVAGDGTKITFPTIPSYSFTTSLVNSSGTVTLVSDNATPGNSYYYGTNGSGTKGWWALPAAGGTGTVTSVAATIPASTALLIAGSPITTAGTLGFTWAGSSSQYIKGDGTLGTLAAIATSGSASDLTTGAVPAGRFGSLTIPMAALNASGSPSSTTYLRGDGAWTTPVTSVAASITALTALTIAGSPITSTGTLAFSWTGSTSQLVRGDGSLISNNYITANQTITLTGNVTGSGTTAIATTITDGAVSYAKIQTVTADRMLGRAATNGVVQEIPIKGLLSLIGGELWGQINTDGTLSGSGYNTNLSVVTDATNQRVNIQRNGVSVGTRKSVNLIEGNGITLSVADDGTNNRINTTISQNPLNAVQTASLTTTDASTVTLVSYSPSALENGNIFFMISGINASGDYISLTRVVLYSKASGGTVTINGATTLTPLATSAPLSSVNVVQNASSGNVLIQVIGIASTTIAWHMAYIVNPVLFGA